MEELIDNEEIEVLDDFDELDGQTTFNEDSIEELVEEGDVENVYSENE
jgi:hypothetical protein